MTNDQRKANVDLGAFWIQRSNSILMERDKTQKSLRKASRASFYMANISWNSYDSRDRFDCFETFRLIIIFFLSSIETFDTLLILLRTCVCVFDTGLFVWMMRILGAVTEKKMVEVLWLHFERRSSQISVGRR